MILFLKYEIDFSNIESRHQYGQVFFEMWLKKNYVLCLINFELFRRKCLVSVASSPIQFVLTLKCEQIVIKFQKICYKIRNVVKVKD